jgi:hypothetical protein
MEAKVDVRKLQILNDRINQTIDALNQVRLSVHGLGHTGGLQPPFNPYLSQGFGMQQPYGIGAPGFGLQQGMQGGFQGGFPGIPPQVPFGFQHSPFQQFGSPFLGQGQTSPWSQIGSPWSGAGQTNPMGFGGGGSGGFGGIGGFGGGIGGGLSQLYGGMGGGGLYHTPPDLIERQLIEARANDPFRITQTFPFVVS